MRGIRIRDADLRESVVPALLSTQNGAARPRTALFRWTRTTAESGGAGERRGERSQWVP
jgi:hypothetical protein